MSSSPNPTLSILVAAAAGIQRDALVSLLRAQPNLAVIAVTGDLTAVRRIVSAGSVQVIVLDAGLESRAAMPLIAWLRQASPATRCVVLADSTAQRQTLLQAGADAALLKGCLDAHLLAVVSNQHD